MLVSCVCRLSFAFSLSVNLVFRLPIDVSLVAIISLLLDSEILYPIHPQIKPSTIKASQPLLTAFPSETKKFQVARANGTSVEAIFQESQILGASRRRIVGHAKPLLFGRSRLVVNHGSREDSTRAILASQLAKGTALFRRQGGNG